MPVILELPSVNTNSIPSYKSGIECITSQSFTTFSYPNNIVSFDTELIHEYYRRVNRSSFTNHFINEFPKISFSETAVDETTIDFNTRDFDTEITLPVKKRLIIKAKVKSVSKFVPKPYLD
ncbi:hypothetical protein AHMF7616_04428 [Adhaeribacter pallidiroseus]|uniref:Uncharacterized protein n=2 Tax=Adhaeribacter pallidiroseus TaxID=2072847 RepID=A0A369QUE4_9BACT|nr:hypothetical protein AHMF7616_04428 [Adhaeribacter pallidiroseus]